MIGAVAAMGFSPAESRKWSLWEYGAVVAGWNAANAPPEKETVEPPSIETLREMKRRNAEENARLAAERAKAKEAAA